MADLWHGVVVSGALGVLVASGSSSRHVVTVASQGSFSISGFSRPSELNFGSIDLNMTRGVEIASVYSRSSQDLQIWLAGAYPQNHFYSVTIEDGTGASRTYTTASADLYQQQSIFTVWGWGSGSNVVWAPSDATELHEVELRY